MTHSCARYEKFICVTWLIYLCDMSYSFVWHACVIRVIYFNYMRDMPYSYVRLIHICDMTHSYVWHDSFICVTWLIDMCDVTHSYVWRDSLICVTWLTHIRDMPHSYVWHAGFMFVDSVRNTKTIQTPIQNDNFCKSVPSSRGKRPNQPRETIWPVGLVWPHKD